MQPCMPGVSWEASGAPHSTLRGSGSTQRYAVGSGPPGCSKDCCMQCEALGWMLLVWQG